MSDIAATTPVFIWFRDLETGKRLWVADTESVRNKRNELVFKAVLDNEDRFAKSFQFQFALVIKRRLESEGLLNQAYQICFSLSADGDPIALRENTRSSGDDKRVPMNYRGLLAVPGFNTRDQTPCWYVRFPNQSIESVRGNTPEEAVDNAYERNLQDKAEKEIVAEPAEIKPQKPAGPRIRPGSLKEN
jgi:hypothetical protein